MTIIRDGNTLSITDRHGQQLNVTKIDATGSLGVTLQLPNTRINGPGLTMLVDAEARKVLIQFIHFEKYECRPPEPYR